MAEYTRPSNPEELQDNFAQIKPLMNATMAYYESARCLCAQRTGPAFD